MEYTFTEEVYEAICKLAIQGQLDEEIAYSLGDMFPDLKYLTAEEFEKIKKGTCRKIAEEERKKVSESVRLALDKGHKRTNALVRGRYLKTSLGGIKVHSKTVVTKHLVVDGQQTEDVNVETRETEQELGPNLSGLGVWLHHYDADWRRREVGDFDDEEDKAPTHGVPIDKWLTDRMREATEDEIGKPVEKRYIHPKDKLDGGKPVEKGDVKPTEKKKGGRGKKTPV